MNMSTRKILLVVDVQRDFIDGTLAVPGAERIIPVINGIKKDFDLIYFTLDWHPKDHCSFKGNGGIWPEHCVHYTLGSSLAPTLLDGLEEDHTRFILKGREKDREEYGAFADIATGTQTEAKEEADTAMAAPSETTAPYLFQPGDTVTICGIAAEYCVLETLKNVFRLSQKIGFSVKVCLKGTVGFDNTPLTDWMAETGVEEY